MDAHSQNKKLRDEEELLKIYERKSFVMNWILTSEKIMGSTGNMDNLSYKEEEFSLQKQEHEDLTQEDMDHFLYSALGSDVTLNSEDCWTIPDSSVAGDSFFCGNGGTSSVPLQYTVEEYRASSKRKEPGISSLSNTSFNVKELRDAEIFNRKNCVKMLEENILTLKAALHQTTKALKYCCSLSKHDFSLQHAECERLLLLSSCQLNEITKKLKRLKNEEGSEYFYHIENGTVHISKLYLHFKTAPTLQKDEVVWCVCLLSHEEKVQASEVYAISGDQCILLEVKDQFTFTNLKNDFSINIEIYSLQLNQSRKLCKELFKRLDSGTLDTPNFESQDVWIASHFNLEASFHLGLENLAPAVISEFPVCNTIGYSLTWDVDAKVHISGFLELSKDVDEYLVWDRKWCLLEGCILKYWNYPSDRDNMIPIETIDLRLCVSPTVKPLDKEQCSWRRTFMLEIISLSSQDTGNGKIIKKFFRSDSSKDLRDWCMILTKHIKLLKKWKKAAIDQ